jgi:uncharacterized Zn finger protein
MAEPTCPKCNIAGVENIVSKESAERSKTKQPWFLVVYCNGCGHVYDIVAKHVFSQPITPKLTLPKL